MEWISIYDDRMPEECASIAGLNEKYDSRFAGHYEDRNFISDETGDTVFITHWMLLPPPPEAV